MKTILILFFLVHLTVLADDIYLTNGFVFKNVEIEKINDPNRTMVISGRDVQIYLSKDIISYREIKDVVPTTILIYEPISQDKIDSSQSNQINATDDSLFIVTRKGEKIYYNTFSSSESSFNASYGTFVVPKSHIVSQGQVPSTSIRMKQQNIVPLPLKKDAILSNGENTHGYPGSAITIYGGLGIPSGNFSQAMSSSDLLTLLSANKLSFKDRGGAKTGFLFGAQFVTGGQIGWTINANYIQNNAEAPPPIQILTGITGHHYWLSLNTDKWTTIQILTGIKIGTDNASGANCFVAPLVGISFGKSPGFTLVSTDSQLVYSGGRPSTVSYNVTRDNIPISSASGTAFTYGISAEISPLSHVAIGARYISCNQKYDIEMAQTAIYYRDNYTENFTIMGIPEKGTIEQSNSFWQIYIGFTF
jgi:hypothetical protein